MPTDPSLPLKKPEPRLIARINAMHSEEIDTCRNHLLTRYADRTERGMNIEWDGDGPKAKAVREYADDGSFDTRLAWDSSRRRTIVTDALGQRTIHHVDSLGYTYRITYPDEREEGFYRDERKNILRHQHPDGTSERYRWSETDELLSHTRPDEGTTYYEYDGKSRLTGIRDAEGGIWKREYDGKGNLTEETDPLGNKTEYRYDGQGQPIEITDAKSGKKTLAYTKSGQIKTYTDCSGKTTEWDYDERGRVKCVRDASGARTEYRYGDYPVLSAGVEKMSAPEREAEGQRLRRARQNVGQLEEIKHPDGRREGFHHDAEGRLLEHRDAAGRATQWQYTAAGLIWLRRDAAGRMLKYDWDRLGRLTQLTNENGAAHTFQYDPAGRLQEQTGFDGKVTKYRHDRNTGRLHAVEEQDAVQKLSFDALGRIVRQESGTRKPGGKVDVEETREYQWDRNGRLVLAKNRVMQLQWFHDPAGNVIAEHVRYLKGGLTAVWQHSDDPLGNRMATLRPDGHRVEHQTYGAGHVHGILLDGEEIAGFDRDDLHREIERNLKNGLTHTRRYDPAGRLVEQSLAPTPPSPTSPASPTSLSPSPDKGRDGEGFNRTTVQSGRLFKRAYTYDRAGQLTRIQESGKGEKNYRYDPIGRLIEALTPLGPEKFAFDPAGNLLDTGYGEIARDKESGLALELEKEPRGKLPDNRVREYRGTRYRYDGRGNLIEKAGPKGMTRLKWNSLDQLIQVETADTLTRFVYDPLGRRIVKHSEPVVPQLLGAGSQWRRLEMQRQSEERKLGRTLYGWEGDRLAWESREGESIHYLYEPGSFIPIARGIRNRAIVMHKTPDWTGKDYRYKDDPLWQLRPEAQPFDKLAFYHCDQIGTPREMTDEEGRIVWSAEYKAWGEARVTAKEGYENPIRFQGQYYDRETGLHYNRHRYYDPEIGRFISKDPIGFRGGLNLYAYAPNPVEWVDPLGLQESQPNIEEQKKVALAIGKRAAACLCLKDSNSCISEDKISAGYPGIIAKLRRKNPTGETSIFGGITVNPDFYAFDAATATEEQVTDALHSMRHEIYHSKDSFFGRIRANSNDDYHNNIDDKAYWFVQENKQELMRCMRGE